MFSFKALQFCYYNVTVIALARRHSAVHDYKAANIKLLMELYGFTGEQVSSIMRNNKTWRNKETEQLKESYDLFKRIGITNNDLLSYPSLLTAHPVTKFNHYNSLQDTGCKPIDAQLLSRASAYFRCKIGTLKKDGYLEKEANVADRLLAVTNPLIEKPQSLPTQNVEEIDEMCWTAVHKAILIDWLKVRLKATDDDIINLLRVHKMIKNKSFRIINENITLAESMGISNRKILRSGYLLNNYPEYPKTMLKHYPILAGMHISVYYKTNPKLMMVNPRKIMEICNIFKEYQISDEAIQKRPSVFTMSTFTIRQRLDHIRRTPELRVIFQDRRVLNMVVHHKIINKRLSFLRKLNLRCASLNHIALPRENNFEDYIQEGRDANNPQNVVEFFCMLLNKPKEEVGPRLRRHPYYYYVPFVDMNKTYQDLLKRGFTKENIARSLHILLYPSDKIQQTMKILKREDKLRFDEQSQSKQLNLILYYIEKEFHFTGNGIWRNNFVVDPLEGKTLE